MAKREYIRKRKTDQIRSCLERVALVSSVDRETKLASKVRPSSPHGGHERKEEKRWREEGLEEERGTYGEEDVAGGSNCRAYSEGAMAFIEMKEV